MIADARVLLQFHPATQVEQLWAYQVASHARMLRFGTWPTNVGFGPDMAACGDHGAPLAFTSDAPLGASGIKRNAELDAAGLWR